MPLLFIAVPPENRSTLLAALAEVIPEDVDLVTDLPEPGDVALRINSVEDPYVAASRVGQILEAADTATGRRLGAIATGEAGWGNPPRVI